MNIFLIVACDNQNALKIQVLALKLKDPTENFLKTDF